MEMPDESCRKCGGILSECSNCARCKTPNQFICKLCGLITFQQFHYECFLEKDMIQKVFVNKM
jgi:hypothetical protein